MSIFGRLIEELREQAGIMSSDAEDLESGRSRRVDMYEGDESASWAATLREKASHLLRISDAYKRDGR